MGQLLLLHPRPTRTPQGGLPARPRFPAHAGDPAAAARGILVALAISALAWIALALAVPLLW